jgi:hypothetical protein
MSVRLVVPGLPVSEDVVLFTAPRHLDLHDAPIKFTVGRTATAKVWSVSVSSRAYHHGVLLDLPGCAAKWEDNGFDLLPGAKRTVRLELAEPIPAAELRARLQVRSLIHAG